MALELNASKHRHLRAVESRMSFIAPNLSIIIGLHRRPRSWVVGPAPARASRRPVPFCESGVFCSPGAQHAAPHTHLLVCPEIADCAGGRVQSWGLRCRGGGAWPGGGRPGPGGRLVMGQLSASGFPQDGALILAA